MPSALAASIQAALALSTLRLWPVPCAMQNADDFNDILADAVDGQKGKIRKYQFAGV